MLKTELLPDVELERLTGTNDPKQQRKILKRHKIPFVNRHDGGVSTTWSAVNHALISESAAVDEPNFGAI